MPQIDPILDGIRVLDGGLATELEARGANIGGPLWSAHVLEDAPEIVKAVHRAYIEAGAQCIATCSYQVSRMGYAEVGLPAERADAALLRSVELAREVAGEFPQRRVLIAGSLGPYGAALHNGAEYHGNYDCSYADLVRFHRERIEIFARAATVSAASYPEGPGPGVKGTGFSPYESTEFKRKGASAPDLLAFETFPSLEEARAVGEALAGLPDPACPHLPVWFSFTCRDERHVAHGESLAACAALVAAFPQTVAVGVNCVPPAWIPSLIAELRSGSSKPILVYPNSGEGWDSGRRAWTETSTGTRDPAAFGALAAEWFASGAQIVGGCCRTGPAHIRAVAQAAATG